MYPGDRIAFPREGGTVGARLAVAGRTPVSTCRFCDLASGQGAIVQQFNHMEAVWLHKRGPDRIHSANILEYEEDH
jgi:hypothetical protein